MDIFSDTAQTRHEKLNRSGNIEHNNLRPGSLEHVNLAAILICVVKQVTDCEVILGTVP